MMENATAAKKWKCERSEQTSERANRIEMDDGKVECEM